MDSGRNAAAFALSQLGGPLGNHGAPSVSSLAWGKAWLAQGPEALVSGDGLVTWV